MSPSPPGPVLRLVSLCNELNGGYGTDGPMQRQIVIERTSGHRLFFHGTTAGKLWCATLLMPLEGIRTISNLHAPLVVVVYISLKHYVFGKSKPAVVSIVVLCSVLYRVQEDDVPA
jgi:hypothetical protein